jgi:hypothetical protein
VLGVNADIMEVFSTETLRTYPVNIVSKACTCFEWQHTGIPCSHALAVSLARGDDPQTYAQDFYQLDAYYATYANTVFPPNTDAAGANTVADPLIPLTEDDLLPPNTRRQPGRPKKRRIRGGTEGGDRGARRTFRCSRCGSTGHSRRTCTQPV